MPLVITVPGRELYDSRENQFYDIPETKLTLEHSLLSISKWESKWHKPYLAPTPAMAEKQKISKEEELDYVRCMTLTGNVDPKVYLGLTRKNLEEIRAYIQDPMTATTFKAQNTRPNREVITSEVIYYWMTSFNIPFDPCQKWHLNRLLTLIEVASRKSGPQKKMPERALIGQYASLNRARRAKHHTRG